MAVLPAPMTTTSSPSSSFSPFLAVSRNSSTSSSAPSPKPAEPGIQAPVATTTSVKPWALSSSMESTRALSCTLAPKARQSSASWEISSLAIRNSGITWRTTPPSESRASKIVTGTPARVRKNAVARPAGPPPITATLCSPSLAMAWARSLGSTAVMASRAALSLLARIWAPSGS